VLTIIARDSALDPGSLLPETAERRLVPGVHEAARWAHVVVVEVVVDVPKIKSRHEDEHVYAQRHLFINVLGNILNTQYNAYIFPYL